MLKEKKQNWFLAAELIIYCSFLYLDFHSQDYLLSNRLKFVGIFLCFLMTFFSCTCKWSKMQQEEKKDHLILFLAFSFTVAADIFLLFTDAYWQGVACFLVVQSLYFSRICGMIKGIETEERNLYLHGLFFRIVLGTILNLLLVLGKVWDLVTCFTAYYLISFLGNLYWLFAMALKSRELKKNSWFLRFFFGMILFFCCDMSVGFYNLSDYLELSTKVAIRFLQYAGNLMWLFYLPGQVLLSLSGKDNEKR